MTFCCDLKELLLESFFDLFGFIVIGSGAGNFTLNGRGGGIRTHDLFVPNEAR
jgi:hypothetical protein